MQHLLCNYVPPGNYDTHFSLVFWCVMICRTQYTLHFNAIFSLAVRVFPYLRVGMFWMEGKSIFLVKEGEFRCKGVGNMHMEC